MATSDAPTVDVLKERLKREGLPTTGRKAELEERLARYYQARAAERAAEPMVAMPTYMGMTRDIRKGVGRVAKDDAFYFCDQIEILRALGDIQGLREGIYPTKVEWRGMKHNRHQATVATKEALQQKMKDVLATSNIQVVKLIRGHLSVEVNFDRMGKCEAQLLLSYPGMRAAAYELTVEGLTPFDPKTQTKPYIFMTGNLRVIWTDAWTAQQASLDDVKKSIKDLMLGMSWIHRYVMPNGAQWSRELADENLRMNLRFYSLNPLVLPMSMGDQKVMEHFYIQQMRKAFPKPTTRRRAI